MDTVRAAVHVELAVHGVELELDGAPGSLQAPRDVFVESGDRHIGRSVLNRWTVDIRQGKVMDVVNDIKPTSKFVSV